MYIFETAETVDSASACLELQTIQIRTVILDLNGAKHFISIIPKQSNYLEPKWLLWKKVLYPVRQLNKEQANALLPPAYLMSLNMPPPKSNTVFTQDENVNTGTPRFSQLIEICAIRLWPAGGAHVHLSNPSRLTLSGQV